MSDNESLMPSELIIDGFDDKYIDYKALTYNSHLGSMKEPTK